MADRLEKTDVPAGNLVKVFLKRHRFLINHERARSIDDTTKLFMLDLKGHVEIFNNETGNINVNLRKNFGPVDAGRAGNDWRHIRVSPCLSVAKAKLQNPPQANSVRGEKKAPLRNGVRGPVWNEV